MIADDADVPSGETGKKVTARSLRDILDSLADEARPTIAGIDREVVRVFAEASGIVITDNVPE